MSGEKIKFPCRAALDVCRELLSVITPACERVIVAGSLRRRRAEVGDVEIVYVPKISTGRDESQLFSEPMKVNAVDAVLARLLAAGTIERRLNTKSAATWGEKNKLARHVVSGIPVDLFSATLENWWNYVTCRTGGAESNVAICNAAIRKGWKWNPYGDGFSRLSGLGIERHAIETERQVFEFVGLPYLEPWERK